MRTITIKPEEGYSKRINLHHSGEKGVSQVILDYSAWAEEYGSGTLSLCVQRSVDEGPYLVTLTVSGTTATWTVGLADTQYAGEGEIQAFYTVGSTQVVKSPVMRTMVLESLGDTSTAPDPFTPYVQQVADYAEDAEESAEAAEDAKDAAVSAKDTAVSKASEAATSASTASTKASEAATSASNAASSASSASGSASSAATSAETATEKASEASGSATAAAGSATTATTKAGEAAESATNAASSATTAQQAAESVQSLQSQIEANTAARHTHDNKTVLDGVTAAKVSAWDGKQDAISDLATIRSGAAAGTAALREALAAGNKITYRRLMKNFFLERGAETATSAELTAICCEWFNAIRTGWHGWTEFHQPDYSTSSYGTKYGDNAGLSCVPSTNAVANTDDYQGLPLFAITDVNWVLDSTTGDIIITAVDGITDSFERSNPTKFVGVMQMTGYHWRVENTLTYEEHYADYAVNSSALPLPEAIRLDGTVRPFVVHGKYMAGVVDGKMTCCSGQHPNTGYSHNSLITAPDNIGAMYSGGCITDWSFLLIMTYIKYGSMTQDGVNQGCVSYSYNYPAAVSETGVKRIVMTTSNGAKYVVGSTICLGTGSRGAATSWEIGKFCITSIESVTIDGTTYTALYVDAEDTFDTVAGVTLATTYHWISGSCDDVLGNDGSPTNAGNATNAAMIQGIEYSVGGYEVFADVINSIGNGYITPYIAKRTSYQATSVTTNMVASSARIPQPATSSWNYVVKETYDVDATAYTAINITGGTSSTYHRDGNYIEGVSTTTGLREWLAFGDLDYGSGYGGLCYLRGIYSLGTGYWAYLARLSPNGNRGELAA